MPSVVVGRGEASAPAGWATRAASMRMLRPTAGCRSACPC